MTPWIGLDTQIDLLRQRVYDLERFGADVSAGCDIQRGDVLYRQVRVVHGPGITVHEVQLAEAEANLEHDRELLASTQSQLADAQADQARLREALRGMIAGYGHDYCTGSVALTFARDALAASDKTEETNDAHAV